MLETKKSKRLVCLFLTLVLVFSLAVPVFAVTMQFLSVKGTGYVYKELNGITLTAPSGNYVQLTNKDTGAVKATVGGTVTFSWSGNARRNMYYKAIATSTLGLYY